MLWASLLNDDFRCLRGAYLCPVSCCHVLINWRCLSPSRRRDCPDAVSVPCLHSPDTSSLCPRQIKGLCGRKVPWSMCFASCLQKNFEKPQKPRGYKEEIRVRQESGLLSDMGKLDTLVYVPLFFKKSVPETSGDLPHIPCNQGLVGHLWDGRISRLSAVNHVFSHLLCNWRVSEEKQNSRDCHFMSFKIWPLKFGYYTEPCSGCPVSKIHQLQLSAILCWEYSHHMCDFYLCPDLFFLDFCLCQDTSYFSRSKWMVIFGQPFPTPQAEWSSPILWVARTISNHPPKWFSLDVPPYTTRMWASWGRGWYSLSFVVRAQSIQITY